MGNFLLLPTGNVYLSVTDLAYSVITDPDTGFPLEQIAVSNL